MRLIHISDTHSGFSAYRTIDPNRGINQREVDNNNAFISAIDKIIELKPDLVLHAGDLFDCVRPSNRTLHFVIKQLLRLSGQNIPIIIISGNHSTPKLRDTGSVFRLFDFFDNIYPVYKGKYEKINILDAAIHAIPQSSGKEEFDNNLSEIKINPEAKYNILMLHGAVSGIKEFSMGEFNEQEIPSGYLFSEFNYIALGHYHKFTKVSENAWYSGSTERFSFNEINQDKGFIEFDLDENKLTFHKLNIRPMIDLPEIDAQRTDSEKLDGEIEKRLTEASPKGKILRLQINNISSSAKNAINYNQIRQLIADAIHFELKFNYSKSSDYEIQAESPTIGNLLTEFNNYVSNLVVEASDKEKILSLGIDFLKRAGEEI
ncbi:MAG: exonuclease SbcCD subunit D [Actinobacteria bacterium]|nr:exonuclease SbcCD subunit D [Actinomycetota bacterium]